MARIACLTPGVGLDDAELERREAVANELSSANVDVLDAEEGPLSIESEVEHEWSVRSLLRFVRKMKTLMTASSSAASVILG